MLSERLVSTIDNARSILEHHPQGDLPLGYRRAIWVAMGPKKTSYIANDNPGWVRRAHLAYLTAQHALPIWVQRFPRNHTPQRFLKKIDVVLQNGITKKGIDKFYNEDWVKLEEISYDHSDALNIVAVVYSAYRALNTAIDDRPSIPDSINFDIADHDIDPYDFDASFFAAFAIADGPIWEEGSNADKRHAFWEWWLNEAVPDAWNAVVPFHSSEG